MIDFKQFNSILMCFFLGSSVGSFLSAQEFVPAPQGQVINGQIIQGGPIQRQVIQGQVIQGQPIQGQIFPGQPIQGQIIEGQIIPGQIIPGQIIQGQPIQGSFFPGQAIQGQVILDQVIQGEQSAPDKTAPPTVSQADAKAMEAMKTKIADLNKEIVALTNQNSNLVTIQDANKKLNEANADLKNESTRLRQAYNEMNSKLIELQKKPVTTAENQESGKALKQELDKLKAQYSAAVKQNQSILTQTKALTQENADLKNRLANMGQDKDQDQNLADIQEDLKSATKKLTDLQAQNQKLEQQNQDLEKKRQPLITETQALTRKNEELGKRNQTLSSENERLQGLLQTSIEDKEQLSNRMSTLSQEKEQLESDANAAEQKSIELQTQFQTATEENANLDERVAELTSRNQNYLTSINTLRSDIDKKPVATKATYRSANFANDLGLAKKNSQVSELNADLEGQNSLLRKQVAELQGKVNELDLEAKSKRSPVAIVSPAEIKPNRSSKYNVKRWIIPFMLLGLGIGLYTYFVEEYQVERRTKSKKEN